MRIFAAKQKGKASNAISHVKGRVRNGSFRHSKALGMLMALALLLGLASGVFANRASAAGEKDITPDVVITNINIYWENYSGNIEYIIRDKDVVLGATIPLWSAVCMRVDWKIIEENFNGKVNAGDYFYIDLPWSVIDPNPQTTPLKLEDNGELLATWTIVSNQPLRVEIAEDGAKKLHLEGWFEFFGNIVNKTSETITFSIAGETFEVGTEFVPTPPGEFPYDTGVPGIESNTYFDNNKVYKSGTQIGTTDTINWSINIPSVENRNWYYSMTEAQRDDVTWNSAINKPAVRTGVYVEDRLDSTQQFDPASLQLMGLIFRPRADGSLTSKGVSWLALDDKWGIFKGLLLESPIKRLYNVSDAITATKPVGKTDEETALTEAQLDILKAGGYYLQYGPAYAFSEDLRHFVLYLGEWPNQSVKYINPSVGSATDRIAFAKLLAVTCKICDKHYAEKFGTASDEYFIDPSYLDVDEPEPKIYRADGLTQQEFEMLVDTYGPTNSIGGALLHIDQITMDTKIVEFTEDGKYSNTAKYVYNGGEIDSEDVSIVLKDASGGIKGPTPGTAMLYKKDAVDTSVRIEGAIFKLQKLEGENWEDYTPVSGTAQRATDEHGVVEFANLPPGEYKFVEVTAASGYLLESAAYDLNDEFTISIDDIVGKVVNCTNAKSSTPAPEVGNLWITKESTTGYIGEGYTFNLVFTAQTGKGAALGEIILWDSTSGGKALKDWPAGIDVFPEEPDVDSISVTFTLTSSFLGYFTTHNDPYTYGGGILFENIPAGTTFEIREDRDEGDDHKVSVTGATGSSNDTTRDWFCSGTIRKDVTEKVIILNEYGTPGGETPDPTSQVGTLTLAKAVAGDAGSSVTSFDFTVTFTFSGDITGITASTGSIAAGVWTGTLADAGSVTFRNIPVGTTYIIAESDYTTEGYTTAVTTGSASGGITADAQTDNVTFTNTFTAPTPETPDPIVVPSPATVNIKKTISGTSSTDRTFTFNATQVTDITGATAVTGSEAITVAPVSTSGSITSAAGQVVTIEIDGDDLEAGKTYYFKITESKTGEGGGWTYSSVSYVVTVEVDANGDVTIVYPAGYAEDAPPVFSNSYSSGSYIPDPEPGPKPDPDPETDDDDDDDGDADIEPQPKETDDDGDGDDDDDDDGDVNRPPQEGDDDGDGDGDGDGDLVTDRNPGIDSEQSTPGGRNRDEPPIPIEENIEMYWDEDLEMWLELDEDGVPLGGWFWDDEEEAWIHLDDVPLGSFDPTVELELPQTGRNALLGLCMMVAGLTLAGMGMSLRRKEEGLQ